MSTIGRHMCTAASQVLFENPQYKTVYDERQLKDYDFF